MTRFTKTTLLAALGMTLVLSGTADLLACGRGGGGYGGGYSRPSYSRPVYSRPVYSQPTYSQPVYSQPTVQQPVQQPVQSQPIQQPAPTQPAPQQTAQTQPQVQQTSQTDAQQTALGMLSSFGSTTPETTATPQPAGFTGVGTWTATLGNGATINLDMRADGSFTWTATKDGKPSTFSGTFTVSGQTMTLSRTDNQQLTGTLDAATTAGFTFKLAGVTDNGLQFVRS